MILDNFAWKVFAWEAWTFVVVVAIQQQLRKSMFFI